MFGQVDIAGYFGDVIVQGLIPLVNSLGRQVGVDLAVNDS